MRRRLPEHKSEVVETDKKIGMRNGRPSKCMYQMRGARGGTARWALQRPDSRWEGCNNQSDSLASCCALHASSTNYFVLAL